MINNTLYILDLDRTLIDTDKIVKLLSSSLDCQGLDGDALIDKIEKARLSEKDVDAEKAIRLLGENTWGNVEEYFLKSAKADLLLFDDTKPFLTSLKDAGLPYMILTFGVSKAWQYLKLTSTGLDQIPTIVSDSRDKSKTINSWKTNNGVYIPPGFNDLSANNIILIDDRPGAFVGIQENCSGYLLDRPGSIGQDIELPESVQVIRKLSEINI
jgi:hypothetical protein